MANLPPFRVPSLDLCFQVVRAHTQTILPRADVTEGGDYWRLGRLVAAAYWQLYGPIQHASRQIFPSTADSEHLPRHGEDLKLPRKPAQTASGYGLITGFPPAAQPSLSTGTALTGQTIRTTAVGVPGLPAWVHDREVAWFNPQRPDYFIVNDPSLLAVGDVFTLGGQTLCIADLPGGAAVYVYGRIVGNPSGLGLVPIAGYRTPIEALASGSAGNLEPGTLVPLDSPVLGIDAAIQILELAGGADLETEEQWADRMDDVRSEHPAGGNRSQVLAWVKETAGVDRAWIYKRRGLGTTDAIPQGVRYARHLSSPRRALIQDRLSPAAPTPNNPGLLAPGCDFLVTDFSDFLVDVAVLVEPQAGFVPDWRGTLILTGTPTTTRLLTTTSPVGRLVVGQRFAVAVGLTNRLVVGIAEAVDGAGITVNPPLPLPPAAGSTLYPAGPLTEPVRDSIEDLFDSLGPGDTNPPSRFPPPSLAAPGRLPLSVLSCAVQQVEGVGKVTVQAPGSDQNPSVGVQLALGRLTILFS